MVIKLEYYFLPISILNNKESLHFYETKHSFIIICLFIYRLGWTLQVTNSNLVSQERAPGRPAQLFGPIMPKRRRMIYRDLERLRFNLPQRKQNFAVPTQKSCIGKSDALTQKYTETPACRHLKKNQKNSVNFHFL